MATFHKTDKPMCCDFNISEERAHELILKYVKKDWVTFISGKGGKNLTVSDILVSIANRDELNTMEKCFLCAHTFAHFEIYKIRILFLNGDTEEFIKALQLPMS